MPTIKYLDPLEVPEPKRDYEFVLRYKSEAQQQARLARVCERHIFEATATESLTSIADRADKAAGIAVENAGMAMERAREMTRVLSSATKENSLRERALRASAETALAAADAMESSRVVGERWMEKMPEEAI